MDPKRKALVLSLATAITVPAEGLRQYAYKDVTGLPTICMGSTVGVKMGDFRTIPECKALLTKEMSHVIEQVEKCQPGLPPQVLAAFSDAAYNLGTKVACDTRNSTAARFLATGRLHDACTQLLRWDKAKVAGFSVTLPGLTKRRLLERDLCLQGVV